VPAPIEKLPLEVLQIIIRHVIPTNTVLYVRYVGITYHTTIHDAESLLRTCKTLYLATIPVFYGENKFNFDQIAENDLPLFLQNIGDLAFGCLRRVSIYWAQHANLTLGLDLLLGCRSLRSLEIDTGKTQLIRRQQQQHELILKCFRLTAFGIKTSRPLVDTVVPSDGTPASVSSVLDQRMRKECEEWCLGLQNLITSNEERTTKQQQRVEKSRQVKVCAKRQSFIID
jgi:hypothetical protein